MLSEKNTNLYSSFLKKCISFLYSLIEKYGFLYIRANLYKHIVKIKKTILITGGLGFIGQNLVNFFVKKNFNVHIIDNLSSINSNKSYLFNKKKVKIFKFDISDNKKISIFLKKRHYKYLIHAAANFANQNSVENPIRDMKSNIQGTINIFENINKLELKKIIYLSSSCVYPSKKNLFESMSLRPIETPYAISKYSAELYAEFYSYYHKLPINIVRIFNTYGPGEKAHKYRNVIPNFIDLALKGKTLKITGDGTEVRDFTYVEDASRLIFKTLNLKSKKLEIINSCTGKQTKLYDLAKKIIKLTNSSSQIKITNKFRKWDKIKLRKGNISKRNKLLGYISMVPLEHGLRKTVKWYKKNL